jgi:hypothetical protein
MLHWFTVYIILPGPGGTVIMIRNIPITVTSRAAALPEVLIKIKLNIWIKFFVRRYAYSLKEYQ